MTDGLLEEIIQLEKQIQNELAGEEVRAERWRDRELAGLDAALERARLAAEDGFGESLDAARAAAEAEARQMLQTADAWGRSLSDLDDDTLRHLLAKHLAMIIPEVADDHPHGQS